ncbi:hypothetical protein [Propionivibrio dicarboxylicus]|uniref:Uncharacterized protein n=1 Tax=Propionivibrio dicarboxylicus TaxID=83767 RepID=A0A1G8C3Q6_9RHOO|nr:hypothetical protein [Propionivibrio dicarboxylicus]SDH40032.1 hypothetical protein SAMN05660652_01668 [Propionivibrio dicarboxylicus]
MKPVLHAVPVLVALFLAHGSAFAYSGSECEVNDCSKPGPAKGAAATKATPKTKAEVKEAVKEEAKTQGKAKLLENAPSALKDAAGFFK